jgi:RNA polymerase sigma-70 factor, ECF subfamily
VESSELERFEAAMLPHLDAAHNLARYLLRDASAAEDAVQDAYLRALRHFGGWRGGDARAWLLTIVRNVCRSAWGEGRGEAGVEFDETIHSGDIATRDPATDLDRRVLRETLGQALERLPREFREVIVLRELEGLSYKEIADVTGVPVGTVMSRLSRGRERLRQALSAEKEGTS